MTGMNLYEALTDIEDQYILDASESVRKQRNQTWVKRLMIAAAAVIILLAAGAVLNGQLRKSENGGQRMVFGGKTPVSSQTPSGEEAENPEKNITEVMEYLTGQGILAAQELYAENVITDKIKLVNLVCRDLCSRYRNSSGTVQSWMSEVWEYKVPAEKNGLYYIFSVRKQADGFKCYEATVDVAIASPDLEKYLVGDEKIDRILENNGIHRQEILSEGWLYSDKYSTLFYVFTIRHTEQNERLIPFSDLRVSGRNSEIVSVFDSGRVYKPEEIVETLEKNGFEERIESGLTYEGVMGRGTDSPGDDLISGSDGNSKKASPWIIFAAISALVLTSLILRKRQTKLRWSKEKA